MEASSNSPKGRKRCFGLIAICFVLFVAFIASELFLRLLPIAGVKFNLSKFDGITGYRHYPHSLSIYRNSRGDHVKRKNNQLGYLDKEHERMKKGGSFRVGFFGDSYTEAKQVPLENTFFTLIEDGLEEYNVECLAFGISGFSMLQSYLNCRRWSNLFDLDLVVYVFVDNDLGDQIKEIKKSPNIPYPIPTEDSFKIDWSFRDKNAYKTRIYFRAFDYLTAHSLVVSTIVDRIKLLKKHGIKVTITEEDMLMNTKRDVNDSNAIPNQNDLPSTWPDSLRAHAQELGSRVLLKWREEVISEHRSFLIVYVPRVSEFEKDTLSQDSWKLWIESLCRKQNIQFLDPSESLIKTQLAGKDVFYDHFTKEGHAAFADAFVNWFVENSLKFKTTRG